jgi:hypothetical protein
LVFGDGGLGWLGGVFDLQFRFHSNGGMHAWKENRE